MNTAGTQPAHHANSELAPVAALDGPEVHDARARTTAAIERETLAAAFRSLARGRGWDLRLAGRARTGPA